MVSGLMVLARNAKAASELSRQIREDEFEKEYLAVIHGVPVDTEGTLRDPVVSKSNTTNTSFFTACGLLKSSNSPAWLYSLYGSGCTAL
ncbi:MAG: hypothetical protein IJB97_05740 [Clostridia bacterium]|nr:hypothetical protein [Clostridia bacterium]